MREIKFRAWHKSDEKVYEVYGFSSNQWFIRGKRFPMPPGAVEIMQYTGLKDKNGKEIYEGDIVIIDEVDGLDKVVFKRGAFYAETLSKRTFEDELLSEATVEVIGNIYENSDLTK